MGWAVLCFALAAANAFFFTLGGFASSLNAASGVFCFGMGIVYAIQETRE